MQLGVILSRLFIQKPLVMVIALVFSSNAYASHSNSTDTNKDKEWNTWQHSSLTLSCAPKKTHATPKTAQASGEAKLPENVTRITADEAHGQTNVRHHANGNVIVERNNEILNADWVEYDQTQETVRAGDQFVLTRADGQTVRGKNLNYQLNEQSGQATHTEFVAEHEGKRLQGISEELNLHNKNQSSMKNVKFNTCNDGDHSWYIQASELKANQETGIGVAKNARLVFGGVPILYTPWADFPLHGNRKSGFLVPTAKVGTDGTELEVPYYLNLAPNYDATITPSVITARGAAIGGEMRYLEKKYSGSIKGRYMPNDRRSRFNNRYETKWQHLHYFHPQLSGGLDFNAVSDDDYYRDFYGRNDVAENVNLNQSAWLNHQKHVWGAPLNTHVLLQKHQTLSDAQGLKDKPYAMLPRVSTHWRKNITPKTEIQFNGQLTRFEHNTKPSGTRAVIYPSVKWNFSNHWGYIRPKIGVHASQYWLNAHHENVKKRRETRVLPIFNVDSGITFERNTQLFKQDYVQTLEPRLYYNFVPQQAQNHLPNFDSSVNAFSYEHLFRENIYSGHDRINSSNSLTFGVQSRFLNPETGAEQFRMGLAQKWYLNTDNVALNGRIENTPRKRSDIAAFVDGKIGKNWFVDSRLHFNEDARQTQHFDVGVRYNPQAGKVLSARFKYGRNEEIYTGYYDKLRHIDLAMQYPLKPNLYAVGRLNYSIKPNTALEQMFGLEYKNPCGCWSASVLAQRYVTGLNQHKNAIYFTLQLKDLSNLGNDPYETLRLGIPGYHKTNETSNNILIH